MVVPELFVAATSHQSDGKEVVVLLYEPMQAPLELRLGKKITTVGDETLQVTSEQGVDVFGNSSQRFRPQSLERKDLMNKAKVAILKE